MRKKIAIIIPVYNEEQSLPFLFKKLDEAIFILRALNETQI